MKDQAEKLREKISQKETATGQRNTKIITVTSGKGGVGKSNFSLNFALSLVKQNKRVMLFDVDLGLANIDVLMGFSPKQTVMHMIEKDLSIWDIVEEGPLGLYFIAGGSGFNHLFQMDERKLTKFFEEISSLQGHFDYVILDTGAGLSTESLRFILAADDVMLVTTPEPTSITDAYAVLKMVHSKDPAVDVNLIINRCFSEKEAKVTAQKLEIVAKQFLNKQVGYLGFIPDDQNVGKAVKKQSPFLIEYPQSPATQSLTGLTYAYLDLPFRSKGGGVKAFLRKIFTP